MGKGQAPVPIAGYRWARFALPVLRLKPKSIETYLYCIAIAVFGSSGMACNLAQVASCLFDDQRPMDCVGLLTTEGLGACQNMVQGLAELQGAIAGSSNSVA